MSNHFYVFSASSCLSTIIVFFYPKLAGVWSRLSNELRTMEQMVYRANGEQSKYCGLWCKSKIDIQKKKLLLISQNGLKNKYFYYWTFTRLHTIKRNFKSFSLCKIGGSILEM